MIAINDAYRLAPWADVLYAADAKWWRVHQGVPGFEGLKYCLQADAVRWPGVEVLTNTGLDGLELRPWGVRTGGNSGYQAVNVAVHLGASRVILLGYDMGREPHEPPHWFGYHPEPLRADSPYESFRQHFLTLVRPLRRLGVSVVNATRRTYLTCFPRVPLEEALS